LTDINHEDIRRLDLLLSRNPGHIMTCLRVLQLEDLKRTNEDNEKLVSLLRGHIFFRGAPNEFLHECC